MADRTLAQRYGRLIPTLTPPLEPWEIQWFYVDIPRRVRSKETTSPHAFGRNRERGEQRNVGGRRYWND